MQSFDSVVDEYDAARPSYPPEVFDALGPLDGLTVLDIGAGTGIATRELLARRANVVAVDPGPAVLRRAVEHSPELPAVLADGAVLPIRSGSVDLVCFAQSWHWLDDHRVAEMHRVLCAGGRWAAWWSHASGDGSAWFEEYWSVVERRCPGTRRDQRGIDWAATITVGDRFEVTEHVVAWTRRATVDEWLTDQSSHSYIAGLDDGPRQQVLDELRSVLVGEFATGSMAVPYETSMWIAGRR